MRDDEYIVDSYGVIHNRNCSCCPNRWFPRMLRKYEFLKRVDQVLCTCCFADDEADKLFLLHRLNLDAELRRLKRAAAPDGYTRVKEFSMNRLTPV